MNQTRRIACYGLFIALGVSLGFALAHIPNVELVTATIFIGGYLMGWRAGLIIGCLTEAIYSGLSPYGLASIPIFVTQVVAMTITGFIGGMSRNRWPLRTWFDFGRMGITGLLLTINFAFLTTLGYICFAGLEKPAIMGSIITGLGFYLIHFLSNFLIFSILVPTILIHLKNRNF